MSILIKGMKMPTDCLSCPCMVSDCEGDMCAFQSYEKNATFEDWEQMKVSCPLVPVPPHGRLIDADVLSQIYRFDDYGKAVVDCEDIDNAPTIIEAEVDDG